MVGPDHNGISSFHVKVNAELPYIGWKIGHKKFILHNEVFSVRILNDNKPNFDPELTKIDYGDIVGYFINRKKG